jgi:hypothetical protein
MHDPLERENEIMDVLTRFSEKGLTFVLVGGYAVSAFRHRFSIDADLAIRKEDKDGFERELRSMGYRKSIAKQLDNPYSSEFVRYDKSYPKASIDLLIGGVGVRQTGAFFSFDLLIENSKEMQVEGIEKAVIVKVPEKEVLIIMKIHSGRLTDFRDAAALAFGVDFEKIRKNIFKGDKNTVIKNLKELGLLIEKKEFIDSFKGVFMEKGYRINPEEIKKLANISF